MYASGVGKYFGYFFFRGGTTAAFLSGLSVKLKLILVSFGCLIGGS
jgi:hypothetical protein